MILGVIGEELGLVGVAAVLAAFVVFAWAGLRVALDLQGPLRQAPRGRGRRARQRPGRDQSRGRAGARAADRESRFRSSPTAARASWSRCSRWGSSLTSPAVERGQQLRCLIAAGGTAGHVAPSLAVAEALQRRGVHVTFAGSPDRIEAQLVPEAGYELDTFRISGLPRRPSPALAARAAARRLARPCVCAHPARAPTGRRARRRRLRRRGRWSTRRPAGGSRPR